MSASGSRFGYQPALDGVRALAVLAVLIFHGGFDWMSGGYVGVSVFFTLSGFLITTLAVREHERNRLFDVGAFYGRRLRRLLPASLVCIVGVVVAGSLGAFDGADDLRRDVLAALAQVYNWVALADGSSYGEVIGGGPRFAPLDHYWSLAIEEQFYWCWPLVLVFVLDWRRRTRIQVVGGATVLAALAAPLIAWRWGGDAAYWATPARLSEILVGATLAFALDRRRALRQRLPSRVAWCAPIGLAGVLVTAVTWPRDGGPASEGWLPLVAVASGALILGLQVDSPIRRALANPALVSLGVVSYGVYLYHWPIYGILDQQRTGITGWWLFLLRVAVTLVVAVGSYVLIEEPIRQRRWTLRSSVSGALAGSLVVALAALVLPIDRPGYWAGSRSARAEVAIDPQASAPSLVVVDPSPPTATSERPADSTASTEPPEPTDATEPTEATDTVESTVTAPDRSTSPSVPDSSPEPSASSAPVSAPSVPAAVYGAGADVPGLPDSLSRPARIVVLGDSTASAVGEGLVRFAAAHPSLAQVTILWSPACGFVRSGEEISGDAAQWKARCDELRAALPSALSELAPDVVLLMQTVADTAPRRLDDAGATIEVDDPGFDDFLAGEYESQLLDLVANGVTRVVWVIPPPQLQPVSGEPLDADAQPAVRRAIETVASRHPDLVTVVDLDAWQQGRPPNLRPDGLHYSPNGAALLAENLLGPVLVDLAAR